MIFCTLFFDGYYSTSVESQTGKSRYGDSDDQYGMLTALSVILPLSLK